MGEFIPLIVIFIVISVVSSLSTSKKKQQQNKKVFHEYESMSKNQQRSAAHRTNIQRPVSAKVDTTINTEYFVKQDEQIHNPDVRIAQTHKEENCGVKHNDVSLKVPSVDKKHIDNVTKPIENNIISNLFQSSDDCVKAIIYSEIMKPKFKR